MNAIEQCWDAKDMEDTEEMITEHIFYVLVQQTDKINKQKATNDHDDYDNEW